MILPCKTLDLLFLAIAQGHVLLLTSMGRSGAGHQAHSSFHFTSELLVLERNKLTLLAAQELVAPFSK